MRLRGNRRFHSSAVCRACHSGKLCGISRAVCDSTVTLAEQAAAIAAVPESTLYSSVLLLGAAHGIFLAIALVTVKGGNPVARRLLASLTLVFAADLGVDFLYESRYLVGFPKLIFVEEVANFLYGPLTWLYVRALTVGRGFRIAGTAWLHFVPFVVSIALLMPFLSLSDSEIADLVYRDADVSDALGLWVLGGILVQLLPIPIIATYLVLAIRQLIVHSRRIRDQFSSIERISLGWLRNLLAALGTLYLLYVFALLFSDFIGAGRTAERLLDLATILVIYTMGYLGLRQPAIFSGQRGKPASTLVEAIAAAEEHGQPQSKKYRKSALDEDLSRALLQELERHMVTTEPYLDSDLTLAQLAQQLSLSTNYLSQVINEQTGGNFFDYVNRHRVAAAEQMLVDPARARSSILNIAMDAGFNSKTAFYGAFRKHTGQTPGQYRLSVTPGSG